MSKRRTDDNELRQQQKATVATVGKAASLLKRLWGFASPQLDIADTELELRGRSDMICCAKIEESLAAEDWLKARLLLRELNGFVSIPFKLPPLNGAESQQLMGVRSMLHEVGACLWQTDNSFQKLESMMEATAQSNKRRRQ